MAMRKPWPCLAWRGRILQQTFAQTAGIDGRWKLRDNRYLNVLIDQLPD